MQKALQFFRAATSTINIANSVSPSNYFQEVASIFLPNEVLRLPATGSCNNDMS
jgi:hypothetical protein